MEKRGESMEIWNSTTEFSSTVYDDFLSLLDMPGENGSSCFTDSMGFQDLNPSLFAFQQQTSPTPVLTSTTSTLPDSPDVLNNPTTPNCSSISSSSTERGKTTEVDAEEEDEDKSSKKYLKPNKKNGKKRQREQRFAFMTKSDVDHLDDSYRWRKYGQKAVKDSPFPRSYYRCTTATCGVKKRIERSSEDPTIVVTTYEGKHTHPVPGTSSRGSSIYHSTTPVQTPQIHHQQHHQHQQQQQQYPYLTSLASNPLNLSSTTTFDQNTCFGSTNATTASWFQDYGLLQDIVPADMRREV